MCLRVIGDGQLNSCDASEADVFGGVLPLQKGRLIFGCCAKKYPQKPYVACEVGSLLRFSCVVYSGLGLVGV